jgi:hypothetical protein
VLDLSSEPDKPVNAVDIFRRGLARMVDLVQYAAVKLACQGTNT